MKKKFLIIVLVTLSFSSFGQILKIQGGPSLSYLDWKFISNPTSLYNKTLVGYSVFVGVDYFDKKKFNLSSNLGLLSKGGQDKTIFRDANGMQTGEVINKAKLNYLSVNTCINYKFVKKGLLIPYISIGPRLDYLISHSIEFDLFDMKTVCFGLNAGLGIKLNMPKYQLGLKWDYLVNFSKIDAWPEEVGRLGGYIKDRTMVVNLSLGFNL